jgi:hypothetical protein
MRATLLTGCLGVLGPAALASGGAEVDRVCEAAVLTGAGVGADDRFGSDVALQGGVAILGAPRDDGAGSNAGAAYVFRFDGAAWVEETVLIGAQVAAEHAFGSAVALSGDVALVGAPLDDHAGAGAGAAYVFRFDGALWQQEARLLAPAAEGDQEFGRAVAIEGDVALVGAPRVDGPVSNDLGAAFVYRFDGGVWVFEAMLQALDSFQADELGQAVALRGDRALVGAPLEDDLGFNAGAAYLFHFDGASWAQEAKLTGLDGQNGDNFGCAVALGDGVAAVGAPNDDDGDTAGGAVHVFRFDGAAWPLEERLAAPDGATFDFFGHSTALDGNRLLAGAIGDDDAGATSGSAHLFTFDGAAWSHAVKLRPSGNAAGDQFGTAVALDGAVALGGAPRSDGQGGNSGSAAIFVGLAFVDCNGNGTDDACDIAGGSSPDDDGDGVPDECQSEPGDVDGDGVVDLDDIGTVIGAWGACPPPPVGCAADTNGDGVVDVVDLVFVYLQWTFGIGGGPPVGTG